MLSFVATLVPDPEFFMDHLDPELNAYVLLRSARVHVFTRRRRRRGDLVLLYSLGKILSVLMRLLSVVV